MKVEDLRPGMLVQPVQGMVWVLRPSKIMQSTLCVESDNRSHWFGHSKPPVIIGNDPVMYLYSMPYAERTRKNASQWGARIVMCKGKMMSIDSYAWRRIEMVAEV